MAGWQIWSAFFIIAQCTASFLSSIYSLLLFSEPFQKLFSVYSPFGISVLLSFFSDILHADWLSTMQCIYLDVISFSSLVQLLRLFFGK